MEYTEAEAENLKRNAEVFSYDASTALWFQ